MMKGKQIIDFIVQVEMPDLEQVREKCLGQTAAEQGSIKRPFVLAALTLTAAAVLAVCLIFGNTLFAPKTNNSFAIKAYALEQQEDGTFQVSDENMEQQEDGSFGLSDSYYDEKYGYTGFGVSGFGAYYRGLYVNFEGENIQSVEIFAYDDEDYAKTHPPEECGEIMFARQHLAMFEGKILYGLRTDTYDEEGKFIPVITQYATGPFQRLGDRFTLSADELTEDLVLYVGRVRLHGYVGFNLNITVHTVATFTNGDTQEITFFVQ